jgi:hypothetical protein
MRVKYTGTVTDGLASIAVDDTTGDITVEDDTGAVDASISTDGVIDTSGATENTMGEICDIFNSDAGDNWACILVDALASDSANDVLDDLAEIATGLDDDEGQPLYFDSIEGNCEFISLSIGPEFTDNDMWAISGAGTDTDENGLLGRTSWASGQYSVGANTRAEISMVVGNLTGTGAGTLKIYATRGNTAASQEILLWSQEGDADISSAVDYVWSYPVTAQTPLTVPAGWRIVVKYVGATTVSAGSLQVFGRFWSE